MKQKYILLMLIVSSIVVIIGAFVKIMHWPFSNTILLTGMLAEAIAVILLLWKMYEAKKTSRI